MKYAALRHYMAFIRRLYHHCITPGDLRRLPVLAVEKAIGAATLFRAAATSRRHAATPKRQPRHICICTAQNSLSRAAYAYH